MGRLVGSRKPDQVSLPVSQSCHPPCCSSADHSPRTAFILYLFDAIRAIMFDQRPELHSYELRLPLPRDETIFAASTEDEWKALYVNTQTVTRMEYPAILSLFLCPSSMEVPFAG
jgi:hypothetical protein